MKLNRIIPWKKEDPQLSQGRMDADPFALLHRQMNHLFEDFFGNRLSDPWSGPVGGFAPHVDLVETRGEVRVTAELPGLDEKDVKVALDGNILTLKGEKKEQKSEERAGYHHNERSYGFFERSVQLPEGVDPDKISARFRNGVLEIAIPKKPEAQTRPRKIELQKE